MRRLRKTPKAAAVAHLGSALVLKWPVTQTMATAAHLVLALFLNLQEPASIQAR